MARQVGRVQWASTIWTDPSSLCQASWADPSAEPVGLKGASLMATLLARDLEVFDPGSEGNPAEERDAAHFPASWRRRVSTSMRKLRGRVCVAVGPCLVVARQTAENETTRDEGFAGRFGECARVAQLDGRNGQYVGGGSGDDGSFLRWGMRA